METVMAIPDYQTIMLPLLKLAHDNKEHRFRDAVDALADHFHLTDDERKELLPSGQQPLLNNRVGWARLYLVKAGLLEATRRGYFKITELGHSALKKEPKKIDNSFLMQFPSFVAAEKEYRIKAKAPKTVKMAAEDKTPEESLEAAFIELQETLVTELLQTIRKSSPEYFEKLVIDVLIKMGYGGSRREAGQAMGKTGDEGIDGIIKEDKLGLDIIYIQAKRWEGTVSRPEIQKFAGALQGQRARKGIFITTSRFSKEAIDYVNNIESKIILIDGQRLAELMIENNVGISSVASYEIKKIDSDYFIEE
jgi:restriction system protein